MGEPEKMSDLPAALDEFNSRINNSYYPSWENVVWQVWEDIEQDYGLGVITYDEATDKSVFRRA